MSKKILKFVFIGDKKVGKTALLKRFVEDTFDGSYTPTNDADSRVHSIEVDGQSVQLELWDTAGQCESPPVIPPSCQNADGIIIVLDLTNAESLNNVSRWSLSLGIRQCIGIKQFLFGNKCDLIEERTIEYEEVKNLVNRLEMPYIETSAKDSTNVQEAFRLLFKKPVSFSADSSDDESDQSEMKRVKNESSLMADGDHVFKLLLIGDCAVGKSSLALRISSYTFTEDYISTLALDYKACEIDYQDEIYKLKIWDMAGREQFRSVISNYFRSAHGILIIFDLTDKESFDHLPYWLQMIDEFASDRVKKLLVGNKSDLKTERVIAKEKAQEYAHSLGIRYMEMSVKKSRNVNEVFETIVSLIKEDPLPSNSHDQIIQIGSSEKKPKKTTIGFC